MVDISPSDRCPCGTGHSFGECCGSYLDGAASAPTAERLMRSRYTANALGRPEYLLATWHSSTRPRSLILDPDIRWLSLEILGRSGGGMLDSVGSVAFRATFRREEMRLQQSENSSFVRENRVWFYVDGVVTS